MPPDIADIMHRHLGIITYLADGTPLSVNEVQTALIDNYPIKSLNFEEGHIPYWDIVNPTYKEIIQKPTGNLTTEFVPFTDSELTELLFRE